MALRPDGVEILRGIQRSLHEYVLPELRSDYATAQVHYALGLLGALAAEWDQAAQRLVDDNADLRNIAGHLSWEVEARDPLLAAELRVAGDEHDADVRLSTLATANDRLRGQLARLLDLGLEADSPMREDVIATLRRGTARRLAIGL